MRLILTGCTVFIGREILNQCLQNPAVTSVIALSRREVPEAINNPKARVIIIKDFASYPESVLREISGADACIWAMGSYDGNLAVEIEYPLSFATAFAKTLQSNKKRFRYVHLSGALGEQDQTKSLWFYQDGRKAKGQAEIQLMKFAKGFGTQGLWETFIVKPCWVVPKNSNEMISWIVGANLSIRIQHLAVVMVDIALCGSQDQVFYNRMMVEKGQELLK